ncbi:uncharacterized protein LOC119030471 [Acanthopagrus latus]|uniref:uncharacterized protein LOC119030471 n=1 Tax=Acanthopagrus latus TaxID=8177 RepID=UPI00187CE2B6|nr:uncharacterized protein LOC119030471 [Acanthopagrus latus]XP_036973984.1 uncharacterized protein LOC119030471 [Acanthopagrus latus]XP_036973985.1 uncharacterized protein LOC119030471 [Acanthopagrus latus]XP_036973986.1 uncharacterized protein LOC119030471 [Acanthopagrus latus]XP_036973987.1 uncharacterized protein LOC119030471 [Acanthopagrus latus]XP_036973988.1 uncharacterized protein LOC119030471 [Acanthopagrus latus]
MGCIKDTFVKASFPTEPGNILSFTCIVCNTCSFDNERQYFIHIGSHLKKFETMPCVFEGCDLKTNVYATFHSHKSRKHNPHALEDFKTTVLHQHQNKPDEENNFVEDDNDCGSVFEEEDDLKKVITKRVGLLLLKMESIFNVSNTCIDEVVEELNFLTASASGPVIKEIILNTLRKNGCTFEDSVVEELVKNVCQLSPVCAALQVDGPLSSQFRRAQFRMEHFSPTEPVEHILDSTENKTFQYVPILPLLSQLVDKRHIQNTILKNKRPSDVSSEYRSFHDGSLLRENSFLCEGELKLPLILYINDFEVCNPLGTSRKKHKVTAVYWVFADIPATLRSTLTSIYLSMLCKANDVKQYGYAKVLDPLLKDLKSFEDNGIFVPSLGKVVKGTVLAVVADNLGAHSIAGFVESFSASHFCRFCIGERSQIQEHEVAEGLFPLRTESNYAMHVKAALSDLAEAHHCGVKRQCPISDRLSHFHATSGFPPDALHDLLEGIVPAEISLCLGVLIRKKYISLQELNHSICCFPYKWSDKKNCPQTIAPNFTSRKSVGGNAHENWCLLRMIPLMIGDKVPEDEPAWEVLMTLKDVVELVMAPLHTDETIGYMQSKISEHCYRFLEVFPEETVRPKHHFHEHYPWLTTVYGPPVHFWTMRFEAKHRFFKKVVRQTGCFRNILKTMARKHQSMIAYHTPDCNNQRPPLSVSQTTQVAVNVLKDSIKESFARKFPGEEFVNITNKATISGTVYNVGMMVPFGSTGGLPDFGEIKQIIIVQETPVFVLKLLSGWYNEHLRTFKVEPTGETEILKHSELKETYPLAAYNTSDGLMVSLKHFICTSE